MDIMACHSIRIDDPVLTPSEEEYLEAIFMCWQKTGRKVKVSELSQCLHVKAPSVVQMLRKLGEKGLVDHERLGVELTKKGKEHAVRVVRRHELAERLLSDVFGHELPKVHERACKFEHVLDDELTDKLDEALGKPTTCPHGSPIPTSEGRIAKVRADRLTDMPENGECVVVTIPEERGSVERLLSLNILPGAKIRVLEKLPRGALMVQCGDSQVALSRDIASKILVRVPRRHRYRRGRPTR
jgi:DtxR family Mn-dependent transcriptional regulator